MAKATLINKLGQKQVVESGSQQAQELFGQGYSLMGATPQGQVAIPGAQYNTRELQQANFSNIQPIGGTLYGTPKIPAVPTQVSGTQLTSGGATIPEAETPEIDYMAGIKTANEGLKAQIEALNKQLASQPKATELQKEMETFRGEQKTAQRDLQQEQLTKYGLDTNVAQLQAIMPQIAKLEADYEAASMAQEGKVGSASSIYGRQALIQRQKAVELAGLSAVAQAYQGNVDMARSIAQDAINAQYQDQTNYFDNLKTQLGAVYDDLSREEKVKADSLNLIIAERERAIEQEKQELEGVNNILLAAVENGADAATAQRIVKSKNIGQAILAAGSYLSKITASGTPEKIGVDGNGNDLFYDPTTGSVKTADQLTSSNIGVQVGTIKELPSYDTRAANPGMTRSDRNNNPGNIKVSDYTKEFDGVIGVESNPAQDGGNFLIFENPQAGLDAIGRLLLEGKDYQGVNAETAIKKYNGGGAYGAKDVGLDPNKDFQSQIQDPNKRREVARLMAMAEGWSGGFTSNLQEQVNNIGVLSTDQIAADYAKLIQEGKMKIENVPEKQRESVVHTLATMPSPQDEELDTIAKEKANIAFSLINDKGLANAVGTIALGRKAPFQWGQKADFINKVEQLVSDLSLESLIAAKERGATFGALSDTELRMLAAAATTIGNMRVMKDNRVVGYKSSESAFKNELANIQKIFLRGIKQNTLNQTISSTQTSTPIMSGQTSSGMGYKVIE